MIFELLVIQCAFLTTSDSLNIYTTYITMFLSFILGLFSNRILDSWREKRRLNRIKFSILSDLKRQAGELQKVKNEHIKLKQKLENIEIEKDRTVTIQALESFFNDVFKANNLTDYVIIFKKEELYTKIFEVYKTIEFLVGNSPYKIYNDYINKLEDHRRSFNDSSTPHPMFCKTHKALLDQAIGQLKNNLNTIKELERLIKIFI